MPGVTSDARQVTSARSVQNVKRTNGKLRFEQIARQHDEDEDDDEWLD